MISAKHFTYMLKSKNGMYNAPHFVDLASERKTSGNSLNYELLFGLYIGRCQALNTGLVYS